MPTIALLGSGEFLPWARPVDEWCAQRATAPTDRVLVVPTASAPEGDVVFDRWGEMGVEHYRAIGLAPEVVPLRIRADADDKDIVARVAGARLIFFSGGNPGYLCETLAGSAFWRAVRNEVSGGAAIGGCSAGAAALGTLAPFVSEFAFDRWVEGLMILSRGYFLPHFDALDGYQPGLRNMVLGACPDGATAAGLDEETALYGDGDAWSIAGAGQVWISEDKDDLVAYPPGATLTLDLGLSLDEVSNQ